VQIAWAAGVFEGEGYLSPVYAGRRTYLNFGIEMKDRDVVERFVAVMHANGVVPEARPSGPRKSAQITTRQRSQKWSEMHSWKTAGHTAERAFLLLRPYLGVRRKARGDEILSAAHVSRALALAPKKCSICDNTFTPTDYATQRRYCSVPCQEKAKNRLESTKATKRRYKERNRAAIREAERKRYAERKLGGQRRPMNVLIIPARTHGNVNPSVRPSTR
jgi:hypothetical protein